MMKSKWEYIHDLKVYLVYIKIKDGQNTDLIDKFLEDNDFKGYIFKESIIMKIRNYRYLDNGKGLKNASKQSKEIYEKYKNHSIQKIEAIINEGQ